MAQFSVKLEDVVRAVATNPKGDEYVHSNQRVDALDANDLDEAWELARSKYYTSGTITQIIDIVPGTITKDEAFPSPPKAVAEPEESEDEDEDEELEDEDEDEGEE